MENNFELLLAGMLDEQRTLSNINVGITKLQSKLKEINISLNIGNIDKQIAQIGKSFDKLNANKSSTNIMSNYQKALENTIHQYKVGVLDLETYAKRMQDIIYGKNSSTYKTQFTGLSDKSQEKYIAALNQAYASQGKALNEVYSTTKKIQTEDEKRVSAVNNQTIAIQKMQNALSYSTSKYSSGVDQSSLANLQAQLSALSQLNPQTNEYTIALKNAQLAVGEFNKQLSTSVTSGDKQSKATTDQIIAIDKLKTSLNTMSSAYGQFVDSSKLSGIRQMISDLEKMNPTSVAYRNQLKMIQNETQKLGTESKQAFKTAQDAISDTTSKTTTLGLAFRTLSQFFLIGSPIMLARKAFSDLTSTINESNKALTDIRMVTGMNSNSANDLLITYNKLGKSIGATTSEILSGSTEWFRAGKTVAETQELVQASIIGSKMAGIESAQMTEFLTSALNGYKLEAKDALSVIDKMVGIDNSATTSLNELATAMSYTANTARSAGVDMDTLLGYMGTVSETTRQSAETIGNAFKTIFTRYGDIKLNKFNEDGMVTSDVIKTFDTVGIKVKENETTWRDFGEVIEEVAGKWGTFSEADQNAVSKALAGTRQREVFLSLMENYTRATELSTIAIESNGLALDRYNNVYLESTTARLDKLKATIEGVFFKTMNSGTINAFIGGATAIVEFTDACGGLVPVVIGLTTAIIALRTATKLIEFGNTVGGIKSISDAIVAYQMMTEAATVSTLGLGLAQKLLIGGGIVAGVMAIAYGINYFASSAERAKESINSLNNQIKDVKDSTNQLSSLGDEFEKLKSKAKLNTDETKRLYEVQNQIKEILPDIGGYYDENGNYIITQVSSSNQLLEIEKEKLRILKQQLAIESEKALNSNIKNYEKQQEILENIAKNQETISRYRELTNKSKTDGGLESNDITELQGLANQLMANGIIPAEIDKMVDGAKTKMKEASSEIHQYLVNMISSSDGWDGLDDSVANGIRKTLSEMSGDDLNKYATQLKNGTLSTEQFITTLRGISTPIENVQEAISSTSDSTGEYVETVQSLQDMATTSANKLDILKVALEELNQTNDISGSTMDKLIKKYPELADEITTVDNMYGLLGGKIAEQNFDKVTQDIADLTSITENLNDSNSLTAASYKKLASSFPDLLIHMSDEAALSDAIADKMNTLKETQKQAYTEMLMASDDYYAQKISSDSDWVTATESNLNSLLTSLGSGYKVDLTKYTNMEQAKAVVTSELIKDLGNAWAEYFGMITDGLSLGDIEATMYINGDESLGTNMDYEAYNQAKKVYDSFQKITDSFNNFEAPDIKVGGTKSSSKSSEKYAEYIDSIYDSILKALQEGTDKVDRQIAISQSKLENLELFGTQEEINNANSDLEKLYQDRLDIMKKSSSEMVSLRNKMAKELQATGYEELKGLDLANISQLGVDKIISKLEKQIDTANNANNSKLAASLTYKKNLIEDYAGNIISANSEINSMAKNIIDAQNELGNVVIENINRVLDYSVNKSSSALRQIDLEKILLDSNDGDKLLELNKRSLTEIVTQRKATEDAIRKLREQGVKEESQQIQTLLDKWSDYESSRLNMIKEIAQARRDASIQSAQDELDGIQDALDDNKSLLDLTVDMLKKETEAKKDELKEQTDNRKEALEEQYDAEREALEDRLDLLKKEANAQKDALKDEQDERSYNDDVTEKQKQIATVQSKITELSLDTSTSAQKKKKILEDELNQYKKELEDLQYNRSIELQTNAIDKELEAQEDKINAELEALEKQYNEEVDLIEKKYDKQIKEYEDYLKKESNLRQEANNLIASKDKAFYERLKEYATEYSGLVGSEFTELWDNAYSGMEKYGNGQLGIIGNIESMTDRIISLRKEIEALNKTSYKDFIQDDPSTSDDDYEISGSSSNDKYNGLQSKEERAKYRDEQLTKLIAYGDQMKGLTDPNAIKRLKEKQAEVAQTIGAYLQDGTYYIMIDNKKYPVRSAIGIRHNGILGGRIGDDLKPNEMMLKATKDEWVFTGEQYKNLQSNVSNLLSGIGNNSLSNGGINVNISFPNSTITRDAIPDLEKMIDKRIPKVLNDVLFKKGIK